MWFRRRHSQRTIFSFNPPTTEDLTSDIPLEKVLQLPGSREGEGQQSHTHSSDGLMVKRETPWMGGNTKSNRSKITDIYLMSSQD